MLSTHTAFSKFTFRDLTGEINPIAETWDELGLTFDAVYTGYLGSFEQIELVEQFLERFRRAETAVFVDPAMADNGVLYKGFTQQFADRMAGLCGKADLVLPNLTEAAFMLHIPYQPEYDEAYVCLLYTSPLGPRVTFTVLATASMPASSARRASSPNLICLAKMCIRDRDDAGFPEAKIFASNDLDENAIWDLKAQGAKIDIWGVGTRLITSNDNPALGGVYKLAAEKVGGEWIPRIKISENPAKITTPGCKQVHRLYGKDGMAVADLITLEHEEVDTSKPLTIFDPTQPWKQMTLTDFTQRELLQPIYVGGKRCV